MRPVQSADSLRVLESADQEYHEIEHVEGTVRVCREEGNHNHQGADPHVGSFCLDQCVNITGIGKQDSDDAALVESSDKAGKVVFDVADIRGNTDQPLGAVHLFNETESPIGPSGNGTAVRCIKEAHNSRMDERNGKHHNYGAHDKGQHKDQVLPSADVSDSEASVLAVIKSCKEEPGTAHSNDSHTRCGQKHAQRIDNCLNKSAPVHSACKQSQQQMGEEIQIHMGRFQEKC